MKKFILGIAAIVLAVGFSAFTSTDAMKSDKTETLYYFQITGNYNLNTQVSQQDAEFIGTSEPGGTGCVGSGKQCISVFEEWQVDVDNEELDGSQTPVSTLHQRNAL